MDTGRSSKLARESSLYDSGKNPIAKIDAPPIKLAKSSNVTLGPLNSISYSNL